MLTVDWTKSSRCHTSSCCVEVRAAEGVVQVRNSSDPQDISTFSVDEWREFIAAVRDGEFDA